MVGGLFHLKISAGLMVKLQKEQALNNKVMLYGKCLSYLQKCGDKVIFCYILLLSIVTLGVVLLFGGFFWGFRDKMDDILT